MFSLICAWMNGLRRHRIHYDVTVMAYAYAYAYAYTYAYTYTYTYTSFVGYVVFLKTFSCRLWFKIRECQPGIYAARHLHPIRFFRVVPDEVFCVCATRSDQGQPPVPVCVEDDAGDNYDEHSHYNAHYSTIANSTWMKSGRQNKLNTFGTSTEWSLCLRRHLQIHCRKWKGFCFEWNFTDICS